MSAHARKVVAVVVDDPGILESLEALLESAGYDVRLHSSGSSLLASGISDIRARGARPGSGILQHEPSERATYVRGR
jgi:hypothetical protein